MEDERFALARRMYERFCLDGARLDIDITSMPPWIHTKRWPRVFLRLAIEARPDLAEGLRVPAGHWAAGVLPVSEG